MRVMRAISFELPQRRHDAVSLPHIEEATLLIRARLRCAPWENGFGDALPTVYAADMGCSIYETEYRWLYFLRYCRLSANVKAFS